MYVDDAGIQECFMLYLVPNFGLAAGCGDSTYTQSSCMDTVEGANDAVDRRRRNLVAPS